MLSFYALCASNVYRLKGCFLCTRLISSARVVTIPPLRNHLTNRDTVLEGEMVEAAVRCRILLFTLCWVSHRGICEIRSWPLFRGRVPCRWRAWLMAFDHMMSCFQYFVILQILQLCRCLVTWYISVQALAHGLIEWRDFCATDYVVYIVPLFCEYRQVNRNFPDFTGFSTQGHMIFSSSTLRRLRCMGWRDPSNIRYVHRRIHVQS